MTPSNLLPALVRRPVALALQGATLAALVGGGAAWTLAEKDVTLSVDGQTRAVSTHAGTVGDLLADSGVTVGEHDVVAPATTASLRDGGKVALRRGRLLSLSVDGSAREVWVTAASVDEALDQVGLGADGAVLSASRSREIPLTGLALDVRLPKAVTLLADGRSTAVTTTAPTVGGVLAQAKVRLGAMDKVSVPVASPVVAASTIRVTRVASKELRKSSDVGFATTTRKDASLYSGTRKVVRAGSEGTVVRTYRVPVVDGKQGKPVLVSTKQTEAPVDRVVAVGTKARPAPKPAAAPRSSSTSSGSSSTPRRSSGSGSGSTSSAPSSSGGLNWAALANCESGGNPRSVSSTGRYRGLYQFSIGTWQSVGGSGDPIDASSAEQTRRAQILYGQTGASSWPVCGKYL